MGIVLRVLIVEDSLDDTLLLLRELRRAGYDVTYERVDTAVDMQAALVTQSWDIILSDYSMPQFDALAALALVKQTELDLPFVIISGTIGEETAVAAMKAGAHDFMMKGHLARLAPTIDRELREAASRQERRRAEEALRRSEERYRQMFEKNRAIKLLINPSSGEIVDANPAAVAFYGYSREELQGMPLGTVDVSPPDMIVNWLKQALDEQSSDGVFQQRLASGELRDVEVLSSPVFIQGEQLLYAIVQDVTERKRAEEQAMHQAARAEALVRTAIRLNAQLDLDTVLKAVCEETARALAVPVVSVYLCDEETDSLRYAYGYEQTSTLASIVDRVERIQPDVYVNIPMATDAPSLVGGSTSISTRMVRGGQLVGMLSVEMTDTARAFTDDEQALLQGLAYQAALAISNAKLFESSQRRFQHVQALRDIDLTITASMDRRVTLNVVLDEVTMQLGVDAAAVLLLNPVTHMLTHSAGRGFRSRIVVQEQLRVGEGMAGRVALERQTLSVPDISVADGVVRRQLIDSEGFVSYYGVPLIAKGQVKGVLEIFHRSPFTLDAEVLDFLEAVARQAAIAIDNAELFDHLQRANHALAAAYDATLEGWVHALDLRDKETEGHTQRVTAMTLELARAMGVSEEDLVQIRRGALLHDIGKLGVPDRILQKPGPLTDEEWEIMRMHPVYAYDWLAPISFLRPALDIPYYHHEKWNGKGYPRGLQGEQIPLAARIFAIVDVWDAMRSNRPYHLARSDDEVCAHIESLAGAHFDPQVVQVFLETIPGRRTSAR